MNVRLGTLGVLSVAFLVSGCASSPSSAPSGPGGGGRVAPSGIQATGQLPEWVLALPEGTAPRDNASTRSASIALLQAGQSSNPEQAQARFVTALEAATTGIQADPENPQSYLQAGEALLGLGRLEEADARLKRAEELHPRYALEIMGIREDGWIEQYNKGIDAIDAEDLPAAIGYFELADLIYKGRPEAMLNLGVTYAQVGRFDDALRAYTSAIALITGPIAERQDAETQAAWAANLGFAQLNAAQLNLRSERYAEAIELYRAIIARDADNVEALSALAVALVASGQAEQAGSLFDDLLNRGGLDSSDYFTIAVGLYQSDQFVQSARAFKLAEELLPNHREIVFNRAQALYLAEDWTELLAATERLLELDTYNPMVYRFRAFGLLQTGASGPATEIDQKGQELPFTLENLSLQFAEGQYAVVGQMLNRSLQPGASVRFRFTYYTLSGQEAGTRDITLQAGPQGEAQIFQVGAPTTPGLFGYRYTRLDG
jgi:tetratricopeptide (TPR) repeat protein